MKVGAAVVAARRERPKAWSLWYACGENIAYCGESVSEVMELWMDSPGYKANILSKNFTHLGVGYYNGYWVQQFIGK